MKRKKSGTRKIDRNQEQKKQWKRAAVMYGGGTLIALFTMIMLAARRDWFFGNFATASAGMFLITIPVLVSYLVYENKRRQGFEFAAATWMQEHRLDDRDILPAILWEVLRSMDGEVEEPDNEEEPDAPMTARQTNELLDQRLSQFMKDLDARLPKKDLADPALPNGSGGKGDPKQHSAP